jgi:uncharacterized membrane protein YhaH (DUF805 family)
LAEADNPRGFSFVGRASRLRYWICMVVYIAIFVAVATIAVMAGLPMFAVQLALPPVWILLIAVPRLHDFGRSGWWALTPFAFGFFVGLGSVLAGVEETPEAAMIKNAVISVVSLVITLVIGVIPGTRGDNMFGPQPGKRSSAEAFG